MLDIINQQGAQVTALKIRVAQLETMLCLAFHDAPPSVTFPQSARDAADTIDVVDWKIARNGTVTVSIKRKKPKK